MTFLERGPLNLSELTDEQREKIERLVASGWAPSVLGYVTGCLYLRHENGRQCILHPDGTLEAVEAAA